ncbi:hypothetical protein GN956_G24035 [Arapaima gigas]
MCCHRRHCINHTAGDAGHLLLSVCLLFCRCGPSAAEEILCEASVSPKHFRTLHDTTASTAVVEVRA